jgi:hypothetical protein
MRDMGPGFVVAVVGGALDFSERLLENGRQADHWQGRAHR